jgi:ATP phosphoribosyltransferase
MKKVNFVVPKGSLEEATIKMLEESGYNISGRSRTYRPRINDPKIRLKLLRPQEIPLFVAEGLHDIGITGLDWILESGADVETLSDLEYGRVRMVVCVPKSWRKINTFSDLLENFLSQGRTLRISTEYLNSASKLVKLNPVYKKYCGDKDPVIITPWWRVGNNPQVNIFLSFGATEAKPDEDADAIIDITETGTTLEQNNLKPIEEIMVSTAQLIVNKESLNDSEKREKIYDILSVLKGVVEGRKKLHIFLNVNEEKLPLLLKALPSLKGPTISDLSTPGWKAIDTIIEKDTFLELLPILRQYGQGLVVNEPRQILPLEEIKEEEEAVR